LLLCYVMSPLKKLRRSQTESFKGELPAGRILIPSVVSHATNLVEHPELVADRIIAFAELVGRGNVIASTDYGLGGRVHPQIAWAKLRALRDGAAIASKKSWR